MQIKLSSYISEENKAYNYKKLIEEITFERIKKLSAGKAFI